MPMPLGSFPPLLLPQFPHLKQESVCLSISPLALNSRVLDLSCLIHPQPESTPDLEKGRPPKSSSVHQNCLVISQINPKSQGLSLPEETGPIRGFAKQKREGFTHSSWSFLQLIGAGLP